MTLRPTNRSASSRGLTVLELVISLLLLFIASSFLMGMFLSASGAPKRLDQGSKLEQVASLKMDEIVAADLGYVPPSETGTIAEFPEYTYAVDKTDWSADPKFYLVTVEAFSPDGQSRLLTALKPKNAPVPPPPPALEILFPPREVDPEEEDPWIPPLLPPPATIEDPGMCFSCHNTNPEYYPDWVRDNIVSNAVLSGDAEDTEDLEGAVSYVIESIFNPSAYIVDGYGIETGDPNDPEYSPMNSNFAETISQAEAEEIANWLISGGTNYSAPTPPPPPPPPPPPAEPAPPSPAPTF